MINQATCKDRNIAVRQNPGHARQDRRWNAENPPATLDP